jgi:hypothetical protein
MLGQTPHLEQSPLRLVAVVAEGTEQESHYIMGRPVAPVGEARTIYKELEVLALRGKVMPVVMGLHLHLLTVQVGVGLVLPLQTQTMVALLVGLTGYQVQFQGLLYITLVAVVVLLTQHKPQLILLVG